MITVNPHMLKITSATYIRDMTLRLTFNNRKVRICDFKPLSHKCICTKLQDREFFQSFTLDPYTVDWNNEIGFAPEFLYEHSHAVYRLLEDSEGKVTEDIQQ